MSEAHPNANRPIYLLAAAGVVVGIILLVVILATGTFDHTS